MNSSISSSDARAFRRFACWWLASGLGLVALLLGAAFVLDPYDTGRGLVSKPGVRPQGPRTAAASRGRDPQFDAAIFGNSHVQLLSPERLGALGAGRFVSLIAPATQPREQLVLLDWFLRHRKAPPRAVVIGLDLFWCTGDAALANDKPFPFWLYERSVLRYIAGLMRYDLLEETPRRLAYLMAARPERAAPDGYWDYEPNYISLGYDTNPEKRALLATHQNAVTVNPTRRFPAADALRRALQAVPRETAVILLHPPIIATGLPLPGTPQAATESACKAAFAAVGGERARTAVVDWQQLRPETSDATLWFDHTHYRQAVAVAVEKDVASAIISLAGREP